MPEEPGGGVGPFDPRQAARGWIVMPAKAGTHRPEECLVVPAGAGIHRPEESLVMPDLLGHASAGGGTWTPASAGVTVERWAGVTVERWAGVTVERCAGVAAGGCGGAGWRKRGDNDRIRPAPPDFRGALGGGRWVCGVWRVWWLQLALQARLSFGGARSWRRGWG